MWASAIFYAGAIVAALGLGLFVRPLRHLGATTRRRALMIAAAGTGVAAVGLLLPAHESRAGRAESRLDSFAPAWQFHEVHALRVAAPPARVYEAIKRVRADEIVLFRTLTWIRRGGRPLPPGILDAGDREPLLDVATRSGFVWLADEPARELVVGTVVIAPPGTRGTLTPEVFRKPLPDGFALATMNFVVRPDGPSGSWLSTETRVFANSAGARRRFAAYWRVIYPGSALIRRMWLRAIQRRAEDPSRADSPQAR